MWDKVAVLGGAMLYPDDWPLGILQSEVVWGVSVVIIGFAHTGSAQATRDVRKTNRHDTCGLSDSDGSREIF